MKEASEIELSFYEKFFFSRGLEPYPVQEQAFNRIFAGDSALVTVPTGTGKTMMAKAGIYRALERGQTAIYTTPLRALTEEKYRELCEDFGTDNVGFATGDYQVNNRAPIQVLVAEILWNKIFGDRVHSPADIVIMDEGHYFNDPSRGYVWEQSIIGLDPRSQLVILSATIGFPEQFCHWVSSTRRIPMPLVESRVRKVPLLHEYREEYLIETVRDLAQKADVPAIIFVFGREKCFETARLLKSCRRFTSDEEKKEIESRADAVLMDGGAAPEIRSLLVHGIGIHHAGILPRYKQLVEQLTLDRLLKFVVSTETISAGINLPAKRVVFPSLKKFIRRKGRIVTPAEFHQMAGRAGRPQFDTEGVAIALAPEEIVQEIRKQVKDADKRGRSYDVAKIRKSVYSAARSEAQRRDDAVYDQAVHEGLVAGEPAALSSRTRVTAEQILAIGLPDLTEERLPGVEEPDGSGEAPQDAEREKIPAYMKLNIATVVDNLLLEDREKAAAHRALAHVTDNLKALGVVDEHGEQITGEMIGKLQGVDGPFVYYVLMNHSLDYHAYRQLVEYLVDHDAIQRKLDKKKDGERRDWIKARLRDLRADNPQVSWEDVEEEYEQKFPRELSEIERIHQAFAAVVPHPELHGGKRHKEIWMTLEEEKLGFFDFVDNNNLSREEGSLFSYLARVAKTAAKLFEATGVEEFEVLANKVRDYLSIIDSRMIQ